MAIGVDTSKYKPRRVKGTPAHVVRNRIAYGIITIGCLFGLGFHFSSISLNLRKATDCLLTDPIEEVERRQLIASPLRQRTGDQVRQRMKDAEDPSKPFA